ncbi:MAG: hypothetical protein N2C14_27805, partial [Planctomycetales bacterium]
RDRLRAPRGDRQVVADPPLSEAVETIRSNAEASRGSDRDFQGRSLHDLSAQARRELVAAARTHTLSYRDADVPGYSPQPASADGLDVSDLILLSGHQPELFHPGVWAKNFCLARLAKASGAVPIHLVVDSDEEKQPGLLEPRRSPQRPTRRLIDYDRRTEEIPAEERQVLDEDCWKSFGRRAEEHIRSLIPNPLSRDFWPLAVDRARQGETLGNSLSQARHAWEGRWGLQTLELPLSRVCDLPAFHWFTARVCADLERFRQVHNVGLQEYRRLNRIRSRTRPAPELIETDGWLEAPFWIWTRENPARRRLFAQSRGKHTALSDRAGWEIVLPLERDGEAFKAVEALSDLAARGVKIRTRALTTTLWSRLVLGDAFIHGVGGAKYDQLTDLLMENFLGLPAPNFLTLSATVLLPISRPAISQEDLRRVNARLRELTWNPDRHVAEAFGAARELIAEKQRWIAAPPDGSNAGARFRALRDVNESLQPFVSDLRGMLLQERASLVEKLRGERILGSREYSFCL